MQEQPQYDVVGYTSDGQPVYGGSNGQPLYGPPGYGGGSAKTNGMAIATLVLSLVLGFVAIPFGHIAKSQIRRTGEQGSGLATAGLVLGYLSLSVAIAVGSFLAYAAHQASVAAAAASRAYSQPYVPAYTGGSGTGSSSGSFACVEDLLQARPTADVVLLDLHLTGTGRVDVTQGAAAIRAVTGAGYRVLIYTNERRREVLASCLAVGAHGVVHKAEPLERVAAALAAVSRGEVVITTALAGLAEVVDRVGQLPALTPRQREVLSRRARGEQYQQIPSHLGISPRTVEGHLAEIGLRFAQYLRHHSAADLERHLGVGPGDVLQS